MKYALKTLLVAMAAISLPLQAQNESNLLTTDNAVYSPRQTSFSFSGTVPKGKKALLRIYDKGVDGKLLRTIPMQQKKGETMWNAVVKGNLKDRFYTFDAQNNPTKNTETPGINATAVGVNGRRGAIIDMNETNPEGWDNDQRPRLLSPTDLVIYEMHFRDFSIAASSGFQHKGKFLALTEPKAINYLKELGVNAIHILPSFDYASVNETKLDQPQYNWGYDPLNYNVPEGSYSTNPYDPVCRIREFKAMVQAMHKAGIRVILDVVYNHTFDLDNSNFQKTSPNAYYRFNADGTPSNGSGCGNETASERQKMRQFMLNSVKHWIETYHIDGFRFDLMGVHDIETMNEIRAEVNRIDPSIYIYGEGWSAGQCAYPAEKLATKANVVHMPGIAAFSDELRDALRGPFSDDHKGGWLAGEPGLKPSIMYGIVGGIAHPEVDFTKVNYTKAPWANEPSQMISYVTCHDDMCLVDRLKASIPLISQEELIRLDLLAQTAVFTSQGVPFLLAGEEMLRDKRGIHNSFNSPDYINELPWQNLQRYPQVFDYYKGLIALRKALPDLRLGKAEAIRERLRFITDTPEGVVAWRISSGKEGNDKETVVVLNAQKEPYRLALPHAEVKVFAENGKAAGTPLRTVTGVESIEVAAQSALVCTVQPF